MTTTNAIATLRNTESALTGTIDRAAALVDTVGTVALDEAVARFRSSVAGASARMLAGRALLAGLASELVADLAEEINLNAPLAGAVVVPALPAPMPTDEANEVVDLSAPIPAGAVVPAATPAGMRADEAEETVDLASPVPTAAAAEAAGRKGRARRGR